MIWYQDLLAVGGEKLPLTLARSLFFDILANGQLACALTNFRQVGAAEAVGSACQVRQVDVFRHGRLAQVGLQRRCDGNVDNYEILRPLWGSAHG